MYIVASWKNDMKRRFHNRALYAKLDRAKKRRSRLSEDHRMHRRCSACMLVRKRLTTNSITLYVPTCKPQINNLVNLLGSLYYLLNCPDASCLEGAVCVLGGPGKWTRMLRVNGGCSNILSMGDGQRASKAPSPAFLFKKFRSRVPPGTLLSYHNRSSHISS